MKHIKAIRTRDTTHQNSADSHITESAPQSPSHQSQAVPSYQPHIRTATTSDASRIAEILVFTKRMSYRSIFHNDQFAFGEMQVLPLAQSYLDNPMQLRHIWVYDDGFIKAMIHIEGQEVQELYVDYFFQNQGIGEQLLKFAIQQFDVRFLWVLEKNTRAIEFYQAFGFKLTNETMLEEGSSEYSVKMIR